MSLGENLRTARERRGLSLPQAAELADVAQSTIWRWESGYTVPPRHKLARLGNAYQMTVAELEGGATPGELHSIRFPEELKDIGLAMCALLKASGVEARVRSTLQGVSVMVRR